ncbi:MAG: protein kinase [Deltaproteobacteria bacterium]|nr:protein kinase [Deltaproteobacteria bacterium]
MGARALLGEMVGSYRIERQLGRGGMGEVYLAVHPGIGARVAIKVLAQGSQHAERFFDEARAVNLIRHPRIASVHDFATLGDGRPYIVMELCEGAPLSALLARGRLPIGTLVNLLCEVLAAAGAAHAKGIVHRDLKPENVFVLRDGHVKVLDFGIAKLTPEDGAPTRTSTGAILGTPAYLSPEQVQSRGTDARADLYAVGVMAFEALTGQVPFQAPSMFELMRMHVEAPPPRLRTLRPEVPEAVEEVVLRALAKSPDDRFATAAAMAEALEASVRGLPPAAFAPVELPPEDAAANGGGAAPASLTRDTPAPSAREGGFTHTAPLRARSKPSAPPADGAAEPARSQPSAPPADSAAEPARSQPSAPPADRVAEPALPPAPAPAPTTPPAAAVASRRRRNLLALGIAVGVLVLIVAVGQAIRAARRRAPVAALAGDAALGVASLTDAALGAASHADAGLGAAGADTVTTDGSTAGSAIASPDAATRGTAPTPVPRPSSSAGPRPALVATPDAGVAGVDGAVAAGTAARNPWLLHGPAPGNPARFEPIGYLPTARALARRMASDAELIELLATNVHPDGYSNLTSPMAHATYRFRSRQLPSGKCSILVTVEKGEVAAWPEEDGCKAGSLPAPRCSVAEAWKVALDAGLSRQWSSLSYGPSGEKYLWQISGNQTGDNLRLDCP